MQRPEHLISIFAWSLLGYRVRDFVPLPRIFFITFRRTFSYERHAHLKQWRLIGFRRQRSGITHECPNLVLILDVIEHAQLARHGNRHVEQTALLDDMLKPKTG